MNFWCGKLSEVPLRWLGLLKGDHVPHVSIISVVPTLLESGLDIGPFRNC